MKTSKTDSVSPVPTARERISELIDGELPRAEAEALVSSLCSDPALRHHWQQMHCAGDALRSTEVAVFDDAGFCARVAARIAAEPTVLAPRRPSENRSLRRFWIPGVAVAASIAAVGFVAVPLMRSTEPVQIAQKAAPAKVETAAAEPVRRPAAIANARALDAYFSAHRELTAGSALPRAAAYLRPIESEDR
jgi:sigma-E factor negative regulatory protein RseA